MISAVAPLSATPLLFAGLQKIARTPTGRLAVGYLIVPRRLFHCRSASAAGPRPLGASLYVDRLTAGGTVGETLPLSIVRNLDTRPIMLRALAIDERQILLGGQIDLVG